MNKQLKAELLAMRALDVSTREKLVSAGELSDIEYHPEMKEVHIKNNARIKDIIQGNGWPLINQVGEEGSDAIWLLVQHAILDQEFQENCIPLLEQAVAAGEAKGWHLAYLQDRVLCQQGKPQIYGTQHFLIEGKMTPKETQEPEKVNEKRARLDIWSQEEHTAFLQKDYDEVQSNKARKIQHDF